MVATASSSRRDSDFDDLEFDLSLATLPSAFGARSTKSLTARQRDRLTTVLRATLELADRGGYDAVRMRDLADTGVALGTIYRFFGSRDFLVFRATSAWMDRAAHRSLPPRSGRDFRQSCHYQLEHLMAQFADHPRIVEAWVRSATSDDAFVRDFVRSTPPEVLAGTAWPAMDEFDPAFAARVRRLVEQNFFGGLVRWVYGQKTFEDLLEANDHLLELVFEPPRYRPASTGASPPT